MIEVIGVKFKKAGKVYYFDPLGLKLNYGDNVIVETARGIEFGIVQLANTMVDDGDIVSPLKPVIRIANEEDCLKNQENINNKEEALKICSEAVINHGLDMKLIDVEYTFDGNKIIFYFTADGRVDFRELVKELASKFKIRIELRQIGVRDEAKMVGGIGNCGRPLCCHQWLSDFQPVSIKMAKTQGLSLNPTKISGICGRLMCCLKYENDVYNIQKKGMPEQGENVRVGGEYFLVMESNILEEKIKVRKILEKDENYNPTKLDNEIFELKKGEFKLLGRSKKRVEEDIPEEIMHLLED